MRALAQTTKDARALLKALWTLDGLDAIEAPDVTRALAHANRDVRVSALGLAERWLAQPNHPIQSAVLKLVGDTDWAVRRQLAATLGEMPGQAKEAAVAGLLERAGDDPIAMDAALSGLRGSELAVLDLLLMAGVETPQRAAAITMLAATIVRGAENAPVQALMQRVADGSRAAWQRSALLSGAEVALLGATMPGTVVRSTVDPNAPCEKCPGGRGGPGGARAFPGALEGATVPTPPARSGGPFVSLDAEPSLLAVAAQPGPLADRAAKVSQESDGPASRAWRR